jgi:hypothetical protein
MTDDAAKYAYRLGRALAETLLEEARAQGVDLLAQLGQCQAEQWTRVRDFTETVQRRVEAAAPAGSPAADPETLDPAALQMLLDDLRAEIAVVRDRLRHWDSC